MPVKRRYADACVAAHALDLVGERWALLVVRELLLGSKRFTDLKAGLAGISPNVLTQRLEDLEREGIIQRERLSPPASAWVYRLSEWGRALEPVLLGLGQWAARSPKLPLDAGLSPAALLLSFQAMFDAEAASGHTLCLALHLGEERFCAEIRGGRLHLERGDAPGADAAIFAQANALKDVVYGDLKLKVAEGIGVVRVEGERKAAKSFLKFFRKPKAAEWSGR